MKKIYIWVITSAFVIVLSCAKVLDQTPKGSLSSEILNNKEAAEALVVACYSMLSNVDPQPAWGGGTVGANLWNNPSLWESGDLRSDDCYKGGGGPDDVAEYGNIEMGIIQPTNAAIQQVWKGHYVAISRCNKALQLLTSMSDEGYEMRNRRIGEVKVLRGFYYMRMKQLFRTFPYIDETVEIGKEGEVPNNLSEEQLWDLILADYNAGVDIPDEGQDAGRVNKFVAYSLLAVANTFRNNFAEALVAADQVISSGKYRLLTNLEALYSDPGMERAGENIFAIEASIGGGASSNVRFNWNDIWVAPSNGPYGGGDGFQRPSQNLVNAFKVDANGLPLFDSFNDTDLDATDVTSPVDPRIDHAIGRPGIRWKDFTTSPQTLGWARSDVTYGPYVKKKNLIYVNSPFRAAAPTDFPWAGGALNMPFIKYSEILLIKAEALIELNQDLEIARDLINQVRSRAMNTPYVKDFSDPTKDAANYQIGLYPAAGWTQDYARNALRFERRLELCLEGHRFFDLRRWNIVREVVDSYHAEEKTKRTYLANATFDAPRILYYPVPQVEIDISRGVLIQDPNY
jgi:starch-binding outer membrane protein, SusD/RagB family